MMMELHPRQKLFYSLAILVLVVFIMTHVSFILIPLIYGLILSIILKPVVTRLQRYLRFQILGFLIVITGLIILVALPITFIVDQVARMFASLGGNSFSIDSVIESLQNNILATKIAGFSLDALTSQMDKILAIIGGFLTTLLSSSGNMLLNLALGTVFSYFMIAYYEDMRKIILKELEAAERTKWRKIADRAPEVIRSYLSGMLIVMAILAVLNGIALMIIGLDYAFVWGFIIGLLAIIPYVGTFIGLMLPLTYSFISTNDYTQPLVILIVFLFIQQIEGNFITPKIVGDKLKVNPFIIILMILIFGNIWGLDGIIISLPLIGVVKTILEEYERGQLWAKIISNKD